MKRNHSAHDVDPGKLGDASSDSSKVTAPTAGDPTAIPSHVSATAHGAHGPSEMHEMHQASTSESSHQHDAHAGHSVAMFRDKFWISLLLTIPTLIWGHMLQSALGYKAPAFPGSEYLPAVFGIAVFFYGGTPFLQGALRELRDRVPGMMTLISLAITVAFVFSIAVTIGYPECRCGMSSRR